jgi:hypothetical protein
MLAPMVTGLPYMTLKRKINNYDLSNKELSIQVHLSGLSFCILDRIENKIEGVIHESFGEIVTPDILEEKLRDVLDEQKSLKLLRKLHLIHSNELSAFVPQALFNKECLSDYLKFNVKILENDVVVYDEIPQTELVNVYIPYMNINNYLFEAFGSYEYKHAATLLVEQLLSKRGRNDTPVMYVDLSETHFEIVVIQKRKLFYYNSFLYDTAEDFIYYVLFAAEQLSMDTNALAFEFLKHIDKDDMKYQYAYKYIKNVTLPQHKCNFKTAEEISTVDLQDAHLLISVF